MAGTSVSKFFAGYPLALQLFTALMAKVETFTKPEIRVSKSQIALRDKGPFAWVWMPGLYLKGRTAPLVLTVVLTRKDSSPRWKQIVEPAAGRFTHHLELWRLSDVDDEVRRWLREAWQR